MKSSKFALPFVVIFSSNVNAQEFSCSFSVGSQGIWSNGSVAIESTLWSSGAVYISKNSGGRNGYIMTSDLGVIDLSGGTSGSGYTFLGNHRGIPILISIFDTPDPGRNGYYAVLSKHTTIIGSPQAAQYHGVCVNTA